MPISSLDERWEVRSKVHQKNNRVAKRLESKLGTLTSGNTESPKMISLVSVVYLLTKGTPEQPSCTPKYQEKLTRFVARCFFWDLAKRNHAGPKCQKRKHTWWTIAIEPRLSKVVSVFPPRSRSSSKAGTIVKLALAIEKDLLAICSYDRPCTMHWSNICGIQISGLSTSLINIAKSNRRVIISIRLVRNLSFLICHFQKVKMFKMQ